MEHTGVELPKNFFGFHNWKSGGKTWKLENTFKEDVYKYMRKINEENAIERVRLNGKPIGVITWFKTSASFYQEDGLPDIIACVGGRLWAIELKKPDGVLKFDQ